jgi:Zn-dependent protease with chaperone function
MDSPAASTQPGSPVSVERWPTEIPLLVLVAFAAAGIWLLLAISIIGFVYVALIAVVLFFVHLAFITHLRGSAVRLGARQFPALYQRVVELGQRAGLEPTPEVYLLESGGSLNALATRFFRRRMVVLFSDLLEACGEDQAARDMVIGHELGHLKAGHLDWHLALLPGTLVPFLGAAYSRAREHTCDRWGAALCGDPQGAVRGLAILAAGGTYGRQLDLAAFAAQERDLDTGWMTVGRWLDPYPPLSVRVSALAPHYAPAIRPTANGPLRAVGILGGLVAIPAVATGIAVAVLLPTLQRALTARAAAVTAESTTEMSEPARATGDPDVLSNDATSVGNHLRVVSDFARLKAVIEQWRTAEGRFPDPDDFDHAWARFGSGEVPTDPFDGVSYGYYLESPQHAVLFSSGPDGEAATDDDIEQHVLPHA